MGIFLAVLGIIVIISIVIIVLALSEYSNVKITARIKRTLPSITVWVLVVLCAYGFIATMTLISSYDNYLEARAYYDNIIAQYKSAITLYEDKAVTLDMEKAVKHAITDLRFQGYQEKMGDFVMDLRKQVTRYNKCVIKKRLMDKNFFYNWYIIPPDPDMMTIDIISK